SAGTNYEEARTAESRSDFVHKLKIALKELRESSYWLKVVRDAGLLAVDRLDGIIQEATELSNILATSIITAKQNAKQGS
ncbi:MAG: four helix bundle protein, partial [Anaerolineales bacterium]